jgi:replication factor C subunit 2/4
MPNNIWVEKYRPINLSDICAQDNIINSLNNVKNANNMPHLLFFGPSGCGKTSTILALSKKLFGSSYKDRIIEMNASDERGIKVIREKIKTYAKQSVNNIKGIPPWKIIILDEADTMTHDSQFALRRIMEEYSHITRFCIICNYINKIIDPIISRCSSYKFNSINSNILLEKLNFICEKENIKVDDKDLKHIIKLCRGDLRKSINYLQQCNDLYNNVSENSINDISGTIPNDIILKLIQKCKKYENFDDEIDKIYNEGYSLVNQIRPLIDLITNDKKLSSSQKSKIVSIIIDIEQNLLRGCDEYILYYKLFYYIANLLNV